MPRARVLPPVNRCRGQPIVFKIYLAPLLVPLTADNSPGTLNILVTGVWRITGVWSMAKCPACGLDVRTPFFMNLDGWAHLSCPGCKARLEMKPPRSIVLGPLIAPLFVLARQGRAFEVFAFAFMFVVISLLLLESLRPKVRLRKRPLPEPAIRLNIDGGSN